MFQSARYEDNLNLWKRWHHALHVQTLQLCRSKLFKFFVNRCCVNVPADHKHIRFLKIYFWFTLCHIEGQTFFTWLHVSKSNILIDLLNCHPSGLNLINLVGLKPETVYEVKVSAINGKGEGESSSPETFKTQPVRKCLPLRLFLSPSFSLLSHDPSALFTHHVPSSVQQQTSLPTMHPALDPANPAGSRSKEMHCLSFACAAVFVCVCLFNRPSVCLNTFLKVIPECHHSFSPQPCLLVMQCCICTAHRLVPACARQRLCLLCLLRVVHSVKCCACW